MRMALSRLKSETRLATVLNAYLKGLSTIDIITQPHDCMAVCRKSFTGPASKKECKTARHMAAEYYQLVTLGMSLRDYENAAVGALEVLDKLFSSHGGDADLFAVENRLQCIAEYGSDDDTDWRQDGFNAEGPVWVPTQKTGAESAEHYGIFAELARFFPGNGDRSECLGSSEVTDYSHFTIVVRKKTEFGINKMFAGFFGKPLTMYHKAENGDMVPMTMADEIESELNEDIQNASVSEAFDTVIFAGSVANELFSSDAYTDTKLSLLHLLLRRLVDADLANLPAPYLTPTPLF